MLLNKGVVITFGGSDGSTNPHLANYLSSDGYEVVAVYFFGQRYFEINYFFSNCVRSNL